jgi:DNA-binding MarR family transcriptional regulator
MQQAKSGRASGASAGQDMAGLAVALRDVIVHSRQPGVVHSIDKGAFALLAQLTYSTEVRGTELAHHACLDASTVSRHLRALEEAGYVARRPDPADARATLVAATPAGRDLVDQAMAERVTTFERATAAWSPADRTTLTRLVRKLADDLENL